MNRRTLILITVMLVSLLPFFGATAQDAAPADILAVLEDLAVPLPDLGGATITVAVENLYPPFNFLDESGNPVGWDYDVINEICNRLNCVAEFVETAWDGMILAVSRGEYDMAADGITITAERAQTVDYSNGYMTTIQRLLVRVGEDRFATIEEFMEGEFSIGVQPGTTNFFVAVDYLGEDNPRIVAFDTFPIAVQALIVGDVDAVIMDDVAGQGYVGANPEAVQIIGEPLTNLEQLGFIFPMGSRLRWAVDQALDTMRADGTLLAITARWFNP